MNLVLKNSIVILLLLFMGCKVTAQKYSSHAVKKGETLESIAKKYNVTTASIIRLNKELQNQKGLKDNTILVIPSSTSNGSTSAETKKNEQQEPIGFTSHTVRKKETLYGIAKRYKVTEEDIKRYNQNLYASQLKKKMVLRIPKYYREAPKETSQVIEDDFEIYTVAAKETRWSIAHKFGISIDKMIVLNPELATNSNDIAEGQKLKMPARNSGVKNQVTELFISYTVPAKMNFYQLEKKFGVKSDEIIRLNPEILERNGLKEGMVIRIPEQKSEAGEVTTDNYIFYEIKPKQTEYSLTRKLGVTYKELLALNPDLRDGFKAGMVIKLPKEQVGNFEVRNALVLDKINLLDSINSRNTPKVMFLLPFRLNDINVEDKASTLKTIGRQRSLKYSLALYSGALVAIDSIAELGISVDVRTIDNQLSLAKTKEKLLQEKLREYNAIIGPLDIPSLREVAVRTSQYKVPVIAPIPTKTDLSMSNVFFSYTADKVLRTKMLDYVQENKEARNIIVIADAANKHASDLIIARFPEAKIAKVIEEKKNIGVVRAKLGVLLSEEEENWVFVESNNYKLISSVTSILNSFNNALLEPETSEEKVRVRMFTTNKNKHFDNDVISGSHLSNLNFTFPSVYRTAANNSFSRRYQKKFGNAPDQLAVRGFDLTYDLLLKLAYKNNLIQVSNLIVETEYVGNKFSYQKDVTSGYFNQASYILQYDDMRIKELTN